LFPVKKNVLAKK